MASGPIARIDSMPALRSKERYAEFTFSSQDMPDAEFECSLNNANAYEAFCTSPKRYDNLIEGTYTFYVRAVDSKNQKWGSPVSYTWVVDLTAPGALIGSKPGLKTNFRTANFSFSSTDASASFECSLDSEPYVACTSPSTYSSLMDGIHSFFVRAKDQAGNIGSPDGFEWEVDTRAPETQISSAPSPKSKFSSATFVFSSNESGVEFECALDGENYSRCSSPKTYNPLDEGAHSFSVRAVDGAGNRDDSPATFAWQVILTAPDTRIDSGPLEITRFRDAKFQFSWLGDGVRFKCSLDLSSFDWCDSPKEYTRLEDGSHIFSVRAVDLAGNEDATPAQYVWFIDGTPPEVQISEPGQGSEVGTRMPLISGTTEPNSRVLVFIDDLIAGPEVLSGNDGSWSVQSVIELENGSHRVNAKATDKVGNLGSPSSYITFTVDTQPPETEIKEPFPPEVSNSRSAAFIFYSPDGAKEFECNLHLEGAPDNQGFSACGATHVFTNLPNGKHKLEVRAKDSAGNVDPEPASHTWTVYVVSPPYPDIQRPLVDQVVDTGTPEIIGTTVPRGSVTVFLDDVKNGIALADDEGRWVFRPSSRLEDGSHSVSGETMDEIGNISEERSPKRSFIVLNSEGGTQVIGGGVSCAASGSKPFLPLLGLGLLLSVRRRRRA